MPMRKVTREKGYFVQLCSFCPKLPWVPEEFFPRSNRTSRWRPKHRSFARQCGVLLDLGRNSPGTQGSPKLPRILVGLHCDANEKGIARQGGTSEKARRSANRGSSAVASFSRSTLALCTRALRSALLNRLFSTGKLIC